MLKNVELGAGGERDGTISVKRDHDHFKGGNEILES